jgi:ribosomal protein L11 methyltransferase
MNSIDYVEVTATVQPNEPWTDLLIAELADIGFESFEENPQGFKAYIPAGDFNQNKLDAISLREEEASKVQFSFKVKHIDSKNWNEVWESNFEPVDVDGKCYIRAPFHPAKPNYKYEIVIEPKMSFGTGHHETTTLMVQWGLETEFKGKSVLDMGCGTGILAILAYMKGANPVAAIDNYIYAYENTLENAQRNNAEDVKVYHGDAGLLGKEHFDIILANITRNVLLEDMQAYASVLNPGGLLFISGFFAADQDEITLEAQKTGLHYIAHKQNKEWVAVKLIKQ